MAAYLLNTPILLVSNAIKYEKRLFFSVIHPREELRHGHTFKTGHLCSVSSAGWRAELLNAKHEAVSEGARLPIVVHYRSGHYTSLFFSKKSKLTGSNSMTYQSSLSQFLETSKESVINGTSSNGSRTDMNANNGQDDVNMDDHEKNDFTPTFENDDSSSENAEDIHGDGEADTHALP
jgi:hypothetical protein